MPFLSGADLLVLDSVSEALIVLGLVGLVSMFFNNRRVQRRWLSLLFVVMAAGGLFLAWRIDRLQVADRDLTGPQQAALGKAMGRFQGIEFVVQTLAGDREAQSLAQKIVHAIKAGTGATPPVEETQPGLPPGVVLVFAPKDVDLRRDLSHAVGTQLAAARIAVLTTDVPTQPERAVRIVVGKKP